MKMSSFIFCPPEFYTAGDMPDIVQALTDVKLPPTWDYDVADVVIAFGGDGTMLRGAQEAHARGVPLFGWNAGTLGYMSAVSEEFSIQELKRTFFCLRDLLKGGPVKRFRIGARNVLHTIGYSPCVVNEVAILSKIPGKMAEVPTSVNDQDIANYQGDGLIISTATGSTAYNLSAGGPIIDPACNVISLVPLNPFSLATRPLIVNGNDVIRILVNPDLVMVIDGHLRYEFKEEDEIVIKRSNLELKLVESMEENMYTKIQTKLGWSANIKG